jgi:hypothetical protein
MHLTETGGRFDCSVLESLYGRDLISIKKLQFSRFWSKIILHIYMTVFEAQPT